MNITLKVLNDYCQAHSSPDDEVLHQLERETHLKTLAPQMLSGPLQGRFLQFVSQLMRPKCILEIGTFTGYGAICLARGLAEGGQLHTIEANPELEYLIRKYLEKAGLEEKVTLHIGKAETIIPEMEATFDLVYIDAGKLEYELFYELVIGKVRPGGLILADNVLWSGKVLQEDTDPDTQAIQAFNQKIQDDARVENLMLPIRDGLTLAIKR